MQDITPEARNRVQGIAIRNGVSLDAAMTVLRALIVGGGGMVQFTHPELGGMGQWSRGGMVMVSDMFNQALKHRVDALCTELATLLSQNASSTSARASETAPWTMPGSMPMSGLSGGSWWPADLGSPSSSGAQNEMRYAYFPTSRRLVVQQNGQLALYDTGSHQISGVSQQQRGSQFLAFSSDLGVVRLEDLQRVETAARSTDEAAALEPAVVPVPLQPVAPPESGDPLALIERIAELHRRGVLTEEEFTTKKAELLRRL